MKFLVALTCTLSVASLEEGTNWEIGWCWIDFEKSLLRSEQSKSNVVALGDEDTAEE